VSDRKQYWNGEYLDYFRSRVAEGNQNAAQSSIVKGDSVIASDSLYVSFIEQMPIFDDSVVLELGCGLGRSLPYLSAKAMRVVAVDISEEMIKCAQEENKNLQNVEYHIDEAERISLPDSSIDAIICFGVFDALYQSKALLEANRLLSVCGHILITGKNDDYMDDDARAILAEKNAREKGHPNYFTDVKYFLELLPKIGFSVVVQKFFLRRGDLTDVEGERELPRQFYEYMFVLRKDSEATVKCIDEIASRYSKTYRRLNPENIVV